MAGASPSNLRDFSEGCLDGILDVVSLNLEVRGEVDEDIHE